MCTIKSQVELLDLCLPLVLKLFFDGLQEIIGVQILVGFNILDAIDAASEILGHLATINRINASLLHQLAVASQLRVIVQSGTVFQT